MRVNLTYYNFFINIKRILIDFFQIIYFVQIIMYTYLFYNKKEISYVYKILYLHKYLYTNKSHIKHDFLISNIVSKNYTFLSRTKTKTFSSWNNTIIRFQTLLCMPLLQLFFRHFSGRFSLLSKEKEKEIKHYWYWSCWE